MLSRIEYKKVTLTASDEEESAESIIVIKIVAIWNNSDEVPAEFNNF